ncbi:zinc finger-like domain-containing protein [Shewanella sp. D64]|uniref:hypothetical protein n=1 Tax=unclassified Shewanella TaxID=196818 RepID=UPI0022BA3BB7|nr:MULTISPECIES: hypothetical protein [unclassified Shewanella]MEC4724279.1 zinc finger-like domain-containing protein [Shewanella sp. D64]MEC4738791.1 zinc finger-like domain-containing protein [Shewanella sp. E94]WBJ97769.1 zinc finger-like domain-containing protein [Shewanella sp. MTB7]
MHPIRLISKLAPKAINYHSAGRGSAIDVIDWRTAAHALSGLSQEASDWAWYRFAGQDDKLPKVVRALTMYVTLFIKIRHYKIKPDTLTGIINVSILEFTQPLCRTCSGEGSEPITKTVCKPCCGTGRQGISRRQRCSVIGIDHKNYTKNHDEVSKEILRLLSAWEHDIFMNVRKKMGDMF